MPRARNRIPRFLTDNAGPPCVPALDLFYRKKFIKHHQCPQAQRDFSSVQAIENVEAALLPIIAEADHLSEEANADHVVKLLREFDEVTSLSGWSDSHTVH